MGKRDLLFTAVILSLAIWSVVTWTKVPRRSHALISLLLDSASLLTFAGTFAYVSVTGGFGIGPSTSSVRIAVSGILFAVMGFGFGVSSVKEHEPGGLSAALIGICIGLLWLPSAFV